MPMSKVRIQSDGTRFSVKLAGEHELPARSVDLRIDVDGPPVAKVEFDLFDGSALDVVAEGELYATLPDGKRYRLVEESDGPAALRVTRALNGKGFILVEPQEG